MIQSTTPTKPEEDHEWSAAAFLRVVYLIFALLGLFGNGLVLFVFLRVPSLRTITNLFIGNQSLIDFFSSVFLLVSKFRYEVSDFIKLGRVQGILMCLFWTSDYIYWALLVSSTTNLVIVTLERYVAVSKPLVYRQRVNWKSATVVAVGAWIFGFVFQLFWPAVHRLEEGQCFPDWRSPGIQAVVGIVVFIAEHIIPIIVMVWVYVSIVRKLNKKVGPETNVVLNQIAPRYGINQLSSEVNRKTVTRGDGHSEPTVPVQQEFISLQRKVRMNVIKTLFLVAFIYIICWTPVQVIFLLYNLGIYDLDFNGVIYTLGVSLAFCNMWINPFIYTFKYRKFQNGLRTVLYLKRPREASEQTVAKTATTVA